MGIGAARQVSGIPNGFGRAVCHVRFVVLSRACHGGEMEPKKGVRSEPSVINRTRVEVSQEGKFYSYERTAGEREPEKVAESPWLLGESMLVPLETPSGQKKKGGAWLPPFKFSRKTSSSPAEDQSRHHHEAATAHHRAGAAAEGSRAKEAAEVVRSLGLSFLGLP